MGKVVTLGEIMLRLSTEVGTRLTLADNLSVHYGGGEANVAISLVNFGHQVAFASKVPANGLGEAVKKHLNRFGVDTHALLNGGPRLGTYFLEAGVGERAASVIYDRAGSSFATMTDLEWDLDALFANVDVLHLSGITAALSSAWRALLLQLMQAAKAHGVKVSFDVNYRASLWTQQEAGDFLRQALPLVDYLSAGNMDAKYLLNVAPYVATADDQENPRAELIYYFEQMQALFPNVELFYATKRVVSSASDNDLVGTIYTHGQYVESNSHHIHPIVDRVGGGDAFSAGILHGVLTGMAPQDIVNFATAASALKHTVHGDCNQFSASEVASFMQAGSGKIIR